MQTSNFHLLNRLFRARQLHRHYWALACHHDGMPTSTRFAAFSQSNPYVDLTHTTLKSEARTDDASR